MSNLIEIKIDHSSLPNDGQRIEWQTQDDLDHDRWKRGKFIEGDDLFCVGFQNSHREWNCSWQVLHWRAID